MNWEPIWNRTGAARLWATPDPHVEEVIRSWREDRRIRRVLDLGCGPGRHVLLLAREGFDVWGVDESEASLRACAARLASERLNAALHCGAIESAPYPDAHFDAVIAFNTIYHGDWDQVLAHARLIERRLRPGGECLVTLPSRMNRMNGRGEELGPHTFRSPGMFPNLFPESGEKGIPHYFASEEDVRLLFGGFTIRALEHEELRIAAGDPPVWTRVPRAYFWRVIARRRPEHVG